MEETSGFIGTADGVRVVVVKEPMNRMSGRELLEKAADIIREEL